MPRLFAWLVAAGALFGQTMPPEWECLPPPQERRAARWVTPEEAKELEAAILKNPADADSRDVLVKHYERSNDRERLRTHALWLAAQGWDVLGVDISPRAIERAHTRAAEATVTGRIRFAVADFLTAPPEDGPSGWRHRAEGPV